MANQTFYYKITDKTVVAKIKSLNNARSEIIQQTIDFSNRLGFESCRVHNSWDFGITLQSFYNPSETVDLSNYKVISKSERLYLPKKSKRDFYREIFKEYEYLRGETAKGAPFKYTDFDRLMLNSDKVNIIHPIRNMAWSEDVAIIESSHNLSADELQPYVQKIKGSEYHLILESIADLAAKEDADNNSDPD